MWHRYVNTRGGLGRNIPRDLYNEHVNKVIKQIIVNMGPNQTKKKLCKCEPALLIHLNANMHNLTETSDLPIVGGKYST